MKEEREYKKAYEPVSDESMERLAQIMNDSPSVVKLGETEWKITGLKPGTQWLIAEEACKIVKVDKAAFGDVLKGMAANIPSVVRVITLSLLNDKERIEKDYAKVYDTIMWETEYKDFAQLLFEVLQLCSIDAFFLTIELTQTFRTIALEKRKMSKEQQPS